MKWLFAVLQSSGVTPTHPQHTHSWSTVINFFFELDDFHDCYNIMHALYSSKNI